jgi:hypothetical protein
MAFLFMLLGLARIVAVEAYNVVLAKAGALVPTPDKAPARTGFIAVSVLWVLCLALLGLTQAGHVLLWQRGLHLPFNLPLLARHISDLLTVAALGLTLLLLLMKAPGLNALMLLCALVSLAAGFVSAHPVMNPLPYNTSMLIHILAADAVLVLLPFSLFTEALRRPLVGMAYKFAALNNNAVSGREAHA